METPIALNSPSCILNSPSCILNTPSCILNSPADRWSSGRHSSTESLYCSNHLVRLHIQQIVQIWRKTRTKSVFCLSRKWFSSFRDKLQLLTSTDFKVLRTNDCLPIDINDLPVIRQMCRDVNYWKDC